MKEIKVKGDSVLVDGDDKGSPSSVKFTPEIEKKYVHHVYDAIAPHFSSTRFAKWPKVAAFLNSFSSGSLVLDAGCGNGKYLGLNPNCFFIGCDISAPLIKICADRGNEVLVADAVILPYRTGFGDAAISIAVLHHLSTEKRRKKAIEELVRVVKKGGLVLITVWAAEQEDKSLLSKWTPLNQKYVEEWVGPGSPRVRSLSSVSLESIPETDVNSIGGQQTKHIMENVDELPQDGDMISQSGDDKTDVNSIGGQQTKHIMENVDELPKDGDMISQSGDDKSLNNQQEYFVPWHLPYHRAEISGASASALANGLARKDDTKGALVYNRYYHVFSENELERLVSGVPNAAVVDRFYDKSNWCIILEKTSGENKLASRLGVADRIISLKTIDLHLHKNQPN